MTDADPCKRLAALRKVIDAEDTARDERSAIWRILADAGVTQAQIAQASPGVDEDAVQKALKRRQAPEGGTWAHLATLSPTLLYARLLRVSKRIATAKEAREERAELWRKGIEIGLSHTALAAASGVNKSFVKKDLDRRAKVSV